MPQSLPEHITAMPGRLQSVSYFHIFEVSWSQRKKIFLFGLPCFGRCQALCIEALFCVSMETGAQAPAGETEWDQCRADHGGLPLCKLRAH